MKHQCGYKSDISVAPDTDSAAVGIRELLETRDGLHADADKLRERSDAHIKALGHLDKAVVGHLDIVAHEAVISARAEVARTQIVLGDDRVGLGGCIGYRNEHLSDRKFTARVIYYFGDTLMNKSHGQLLHEHGAVAQTLIVALIRLAYRHLDGTENDLVLREVYLFVRRVNELGRYKLIYFIYHCSQPPEVRLQL